MSLQNLISFQIQTKKLTQKVFLILTNFTILMNKMKSLFFLVHIALVTFLIGCEEAPTKKTGSLKLGDSSLIVTEVDSLYLQNQTADISPSKKQSSAKEITSMMVQVDSLKASQKLENQSNSEIVQGFEINFKECKVVFNGLSAHALNNAQDERNSSSVSYMKDAGRMEEMKLKVEGLNDVKVEQRVYTKLYITQNDESFRLNDLGKYTSPWFNLAGKADVFISTGSNGAGFLEVNKQKISNAFDRELRKKKLNRKDIESKLKWIEKTNLYSDPPCEVKVVSSQWRIVGTKDGKRVQKLIQFDEPEN